MKVVIRGDGTADIVTDNNSTLVQEDVLVEFLSENAFKEFLRNILKS